ncbi:uncharacterized protein LOC122572242 isoform X1 [Bombus pyrosoma]|uniref:uncharacterized protein LOC122572242 isoform X1 n=1 Tax=Bombus pyrosoma TaxID=396416 RepID=UPI001CB97347|nr:uncharacterized protein LOC122572242 isoform X1 [Bombus pyrosoma]
MNTFGSRSYAQVTNQTPPLNNQDNNNNNAVEIKELLKQSIKNTEMLTKMIKTHFTPKSYMKIPYYTIYNNKHCSGKAHGEAAVIRNDIKHHLHSQISQENVQATTVTIQTNSNYFQMSAVHARP